MISLAQADTTSIFDNSVLDRWEIPFGDWFDQSVDWIDNNLQGLLDVIEWPFKTLIDWIVRDILIQASWVWVVLAMVLIASLMRNIRVGVFVGVALTTCGLLGPGYWLETARTIGFIGVAVLLCVIVGIPIGIASGRVEGVWQVTRPVLDAMQVVHSFVYMIPFIFFWGIGEVSATMVTMIFALPPLIRLTNLGIRQVPADVVEAARAHGAPEWRVLFDVQLPLARPAIMTGINQTLLLAISMLGIAAIMGAGGLGRLLFRSLSNQDVALAASAGLAFFLVAVALDRMTQREDADQGNLFRRIRAAWAHRRDPEALLPPGGAVDTYDSSDRFEPIMSRERLPMAVALAGGALATASVFLPWTQDAGKISAYGNRADEDLPGMVMNGLDASGGSFFGIIVLVAGLLVVGSVLVAFVWPGRGPRWLTADGTVIAGFTALITAGAFYLARPAPLATDPGTGIGVMLALTGGAAASLGSLLWVRSAPHVPEHPLRSGISWGRIIGVGIAALVLVGGALLGWSFDERTDVIIGPEVQAEIDELRAEAAEDPTKASVIANEIAGLIASAQASGEVVTTGVDDEGAGLGVWTIVLGLAALVTTLPAAGVLGDDEHRKWVWSAVTAGAGAGITAIAFAWIFTFVRNADPNFLSGIGSFLTLMGGFSVLASTMPVLKEFHRAKVYDDALTGLADDALAAVAAEAVEQPI